MMLGLRRLLICEGLQWSHRIIEVDRIWEKQTNIHLEPHLILFDNMQLIIHTD
jgi:hypothetical protein